MASSYMRYSHSVNEIFSGFWETWGYLDSNFKRRLIFFFFFGVKTVRWRRKPEENTISG